MGAAALPWTHDSFALDIKPEAHTLCGDLSITAKFNGEVIDATTGDVLNYVPGSSQFTCETADTSLHDKSFPYSLEAQLIAWPSVQAQTVSQIDFGHQCEVPTAFAATSQQSPAPNKYTGTKILYELNPFTIQPVDCKVDYECTSVARVDGEVSKIGCIDLNFDGVFDGDLLDGKIDFAADMASYTSKRFPPGQYTVTVTGTAIKSTDKL